MLVPDIPRNEKQRIVALESLDILDTSAEERLDRITRLVSRSFQVPICLVSLIDTNRQWFASCIGLDVRETGRDISFCGHAILGSELFIINDTAKDERFADNPLVTGEPRIRFYAGCPLNINGYNIGTLCIIDRRPRELSHGQREVLIHFAKMVEDELLLTYESTIDSNTGYSNLKGFCMLAYARIEGCLAENKKVEFAMVYAHELLNIDKEKANHYQQIIADNLRDNFDQAESIATFNGNQFLVMLVDCDESDYVRQLDAFLSVLETIEPERNLFNELGITVEKRTCKVKSINELETSLMT